MQTVTKLLKANLRQYGMLIALLFIMILFQILTGGILFKPLNVTNLILQNSYILVLAIGMVLVIISGHIDLSVGSVAAFVGAVSAVMMVQWNVPFVAAIILSLLLGALIGAWQGFWVAYVRVPSFIVTLVFRGLTMLVLKGQSVGPFPDAFRSISSGFIPDFPGSGGLHLASILIGIALTALLIWNEWLKRKSNIRYNFEVMPLGYFVAQMALLALALNLLVYVLASYEGIPNILIILMVLIALYTFVTNRTVIGRHIYAMGGNEKAAMLSGVKTKRVTFWVFVNMGTLAALSGLIFAARLNAATPKAGQNFELDAIAACFIGGASMSGGVGTVIGAVIGGLVMGVMNNGMSILGIGIDWQQGIKGLVLLLAVAFDIYNRNKSS